MTSSQAQQELLDFLRCDRMRNIVPLKMLAAHGAAIQCYFQRKGNDAGAMRLFPTNLFAYDRQTYADLDLVVLIAANTAAVVETLLEQLPHDQKLVFKIMSEEVRNVLAQHFSLRRARAFVSYTSALHALRQRHRKPRYQVDETNLPSIKLAESLGLMPFVTVKHWLNRT